MGIPYLEITSKGKKAAYSRDGGLCGIRKLEIVSTGTETVGVHYLHAVTEWHSMTSSARRPLDHSALPCEP